VKTKFIVAHAGHHCYGKEYEMDDCPLLQFKMLVWGDWGNLRVTDIALSLNGDEPKQVVYLGLVNIHA
jgi:hypothetical protein